MTDVLPLSPDELLSTTRAVRKRLDLERPVEREVIIECLELAQQAPTGSNMQGWRWMVVTDADKRAELARLYRETADGYLAAAAAEHTEGQGKRVYDSAMYLSDVLEQVPVHVIPCIEGRFEGMPNIGAASMYGSIIPAAWSFLLALRSRGLGSSWTTLHLAKEQEAAELLGIPYDRVTQIALFPVAYTQGTDFKPATREPVERITSFNTWSE